MSFSQCLEISANLAAIATSALAAWAYLKFRSDRRHCRIALKSYLLNELNTKPETCQKSLLHLMAQLSMTEAEVLAAGFEAKREGVVRTRLLNNKAGYAQKSCSSIADRNLQKGNSQGRPQLHTASGGKLIRIASMLPPVFRPNSVPRS